MKTTSKRKMKTIAIWTHKGGSAKTTTAFTLACYATAQGYNVWLTCLDEQGDSARASAGWDKPLNPTDPVDSPHGYISYWDIKGFSSLQRDYPDNTDLLILDLAPGTTFVPHVHPDLWVCPIKERAGLQNTSDALHLMQKSGGQIAMMLANYNRVSAIAFDLEEAIKTIKGITTLPSIPASNIIEKVLAEAQPPWKVTWGINSDGSVAYERACERILQLVGYTTSNKINRTGGHK
jgi:MinD-like ATPase involved in chromosome partitioning or flagellar assembly